MLHINWRQQYYTENVMLMSPAFIWYAKCLYSSDFEFFELGIWLQGQTRSRTLKRCQIRKIIGQNRGSWTSMWALSNENCGLSPSPPPKSSSQLQKAPESNSTNLSVARSTVKEQFAKNHPVQWGPWSCQGAWRLWDQGRAYYWVRLVKGLLELQGFQAMTWKLK